MFVKRCCIPDSLRKPVQDALDRLVCEGIISPVLDSQ